MTFPDGRSFSWTAVRAPRLDRTSKPLWGASIRLLHANDLGGWHPSGPSNQWHVTKGVLRQSAIGANLVTDRKFEDFKLHVEFRYPKESNSGVYLRGGTRCRSRTISARAPGTIVQRDLWIHFAERDGGETGG